MRLPCQGVGGLGDARFREIIAVAGRQLGRAVVNPPGQAVFQQAGQGAVDGRQRFTQDQREFPRVDQWQPGQGVQDALS